MCGRYEHANPIHGTTQNDRLNCYANRYHYYHLFRNYVVKVLVRPIVEHSACLLLREIQFLFAIDFVDVAAIAVGVVVVD